MVWLEEMGVGSAAAAGRSWAPVGQTRSARQPASALGSTEQRHLQRGRLGFRLFTGSFSSRVFIDFLGRLLGDCGGRKGHLIVDGHAVHRARLVSAWVGRHADQIELHVLPGSSPELQPGGVVEPRCQGERGGRRRPGRRVSFALSCTAICVAATAPRRLVRFFASPTTRYAAAS